MNNHKTNTREYFYKINYFNGGQRSSGVLSGLPEYFQKCESSDWEVNSLSYNPMDHSNGNHVTYSEVTEADGNGFIVHTFSNHDNGYMDKPPFGTYMLGSCQSFYRTYAFGKLELERGLTLSVRYYTEAKDLMKEEINEYNNDPNRFNEFVRSIHDEYSSNPNVLYARLSLAYPIYTYYPYLKRKIINEYQDNGVASIQTEYSYDHPYMLMRSKSKTNSKGNVIKELYSYPNDMVSANEDPNGIYLSMVNKNIITPTVKTVRYNNEKQIETTTIHFFEPHPGLYVPHYSENKNGNNLPFRSITFNSYDLLGNVLEFSKSDDIPVSYFWGYGGEYPVAKTVGLNRTATEQYITQSILDNPISDEQIRSELNKLRGLPGAQVSTFSFNPLVGMTSMTDANGNTTYFEYDAFNRLKILKDLNQNVQSSYRYKFIRELNNGGVVYYNTSLSGTYTRNDCESSKTGTSVIYTVPVDKYSSLISQEDADLQAQFEINSAGQNHANINGACIDACSSENCSGIDKKCVNGTCEAGVRVIASSVKNGAVWECRYYYQWSDGSTSQIYINYSPTPCS